MNNELNRTADLESGVHEEAVSIRVADAVVYGNVDVPATPGETGIIAVHGWSGYRHGPHGLLTFLCRRLAACGYPTLRFDFRGRGESDGDGLQASLPTMADDLVASSEWFARTYGLQTIVYLGICSGGNVAIGTLKRLPAAGALILLSVYPFSDGDAFGRDLHRTWHYARVYLHKAMQKETWSRLFNGDVHLKQVLNVLFGHFVRRGKNVEKETVSADSKTSGKTAKPSAGESRNATGDAPRTHLANLSDDLPALMIYGTADPDAAAAKTYYGEYARDKRLPIRFVDIKGANHNFSSVTWKEELMALATEFLDGLPRG